MIAIEAHAEGAILPVRAQPGARRNEIRGEYEGMLKVCVTQVAEKGKANKAIIEVLAKQLDLRKSQIALLTGETAAQKRFLVREVSAAALSQCVQRLLADRQGEQDRKEQSR